MLYFRLSHEILSVSIMDFYTYLHDDVKYETPIDYNSLTPIHRCFHCAPARAPYRLICVPQSYGQIFTPQTKL